MNEENKLIAEERKVLLNQSLANMSIKAECVSYVIGSTYTRYNIEYKRNGTLRSLTSVIPDLSIRLGVSSLRFIPSVPNEPYSAVEVLNEHQEVISYEEVYKQLDDNPLSIPFGLDINGKLVQADLHHLPHILLVGTTGSGKSVFLNTVLSTLIRRNSPRDVRFVLIDPKYVEMNKYKGLPHLHAPIMNKPKEAYEALLYLVREMEDRYKALMKDNASDIREYNLTHRRKLPYIVVVIDEYMDLYDSIREAKIPITTLLQKARAAGIHIILSSQRMPVSALTGTMKANFGCRVALATASVADSITVIDEPSAESLGGCGDMLIKCPLVSRDYLIRVQGCYTRGSEVKEIVDKAKEKYPVDEEIPPFDDFLENKPSEVIDKEEQTYQRVKEWVEIQEYISASKIQRECYVGFNRSNKLLSRLQKEGIVSTEMDKKGFKVIKK